MKQKIKEYDDEHDARITFNFYSEHNHELPGRILTYFEYDSNTCGADISENLIEPNWNQWSIVQKYLPTTQQSRRCISKNFLSKQIW